MKNVKKLLTVFVVLLSLQACSTTPKATPKPFEPDPLVILNCPNLTPFDTNITVSLGEAVKKIVEISGQYYKCQMSALRNPNSE